MPIEQFKTLENTPPKMRRTCAEGYESVLHSLTVDCALGFRFQVFTYLKYSDDTVILGLLQDEDSIAAYQYFVSHLPQRHRDNHLQLDGSKTKEMITGSPKLGKMCRL